MSQPLPSPVVSTPITKASSEKIRLNSSVDLVDDIPESPDGRVSNADSDDKGMGETKFSGRKKWFLLFLFSVSQYLDIASRASALILIDDISKDLGVEYETSTWILNSYGVTFGSFLLLWGRVSDLQSAKPIFSMAFLWCGIWSVIISFMTEQYSFYIFRALYGISAAATIPSAFRLIRAVFEPGEVQSALALFGMSGALANATGLLLGGAFGQITSTGQMVGWRWFFRGVAAISIPFALIAHMLLPATRGLQHDVPHKWRHLDLIGSTLILASLLLLNVGLTLGASRGWGTAYFIAPFVASWPSAAAFFWWEHRREDNMAVLPKSMWKVPNMKLMTCCGLYLFSVIACAQLPLVERYQMVFGESPINAAVRMLPQGLAMCIAAIITARVSKKVNNLRLPIGICLIIAGSALVVFIHGDGDIGPKYWKFYVPAFIVGSTALAIAYLGINVTIMTSVPSTMAGVAGALWQVALQTGVVTAYHIQAGLMTINTGGISNWSNTSASFWFLFGWGILCGVAVLVFYQKRTIVGEEDLGEKERQVYLTDTKSPA